MAIQLTSSAFKEGQAIPVKYTCDGENVSPALRWSGVPAGTRSLALIADDPDAPRGTFTHWVLFGIPAQATELGEGQETIDSLTNGPMQGRNDFGRMGYGGPCPPRGNPHRYFFKLYALDTVLKLPPNPTRQDLLHAMEQHIIAEGQLMGTYQRR
jgi:Raf kinase inhibitor-like YbhB/YbcL family protein